jgi:hypothetical protein
VYHKSRLYKFTKFSNDDSYLLLKRKESTFHAPSVQHVDTLLLPSVLDIRDDSIHLDSIHGNKQIVQPDMNPEKMPKREIFTI